jgi:hypothetical protein
MSEAEEMPKEHALRTRSWWLSCAVNNFWLLIGSMWFAVGSLFFCVGLFDWIQIGGLDQRFERDARTVQGTVLTKTTTSSTSGFGTHRRSSRSYHVSYRFGTPEGREFEDTAGVYSEAWDQLAAGGPIQVTYLADEPLTNRVEGRTDVGSAAAAVLMGGLLAIVGGAFFFWHLRRFLRTRRLRRDGTAAEATVLQIERSAMYVNHAQQWRIRYRYRDHLGRTQEGQSGYLSPDAAAAWHADDKGTVRFDRLRPQDSVWVGKP